MLARTSSRLRCRFQSTLPGLNLSTAIVAIDGATRVVRQESSKLESSTVEDQITPQLCAKLVPDHIIRASWRFQKELRSREAKSLAQQVQLVDGSTLRLRPRSSYTRSPHSSQRLEALSSLQKKRQEGLVFDFVLKLLGAEKHACMQSTGWRMTGVSQSPDHRYLTIRWTIEDPAKLEKYSHPLNVALGKFGMVVRHRLASEFSLRVAPEVRFQYENTLETESLVFAAEKPDKST